MLCPAGKELRTASHVSVPCLGTISKATPIPPRGHDVVLRLGSRVQAALCEHCPRLCPASQGLPLWKVCQGPVRGHAECSAMCQLSPSSPRWAQLLPWVHSVPGGDQSWGQGEALSQGAGPRDSGFCLLALANQLLPSLGSLPAWGLLQSHPEADGAAPRAATQPLLVESLTSHTLPPRPGRGPCRGP